MKAVHTGLALSLLWAGAVAAQDQAESWRKYTNERFGFSAPSFPRFCSREAIGCR